eukprot:SAG31_NODE_568_length_14006_cov_4.252119_8_plen_46_part_00
MLPSLIALLSLDKMQHPDVRWLTLETLKNLGNYAQHMQTSICCAF